MFVTDSSNDLAIVLAKFGLRSDATLISEISRTEAHAILTKLLWKDLAYGVECMPLDTAAAFADRFLSESESSQCKYFSNVANSESNQWQPFTSSTFDSGVIVSGPTGRHACLWIEDED